MHKRTVLLAKNDLFQTTPRNELGESRDAFDHQCMSRYHTNTNTRKEFNYTNIEVLQRSLRDFYVQCYVYDIIT